MNGVLKFIYEVGDNLCDAYYSGVGNGFKYGLMWDSNVSFKRIKINMFVFSLNINMTFVYSRIKFIIKTLVILNYNFDKILYVFVMLGF